MKALKIISSLLFALIMCTGAAIVCYCSIDFFQQCQSDCQKWMEGFANQLSAHQIHFPNE